MRIGDVAIFFLLAWLDHASISNPRRDSCLWISAAWRWWCILVANGQEKGVEVSEDSVRGVTKGETRKISPFCED
ncbi:hypothetical protein QL093DRAFT_2140912 [Fusarium oxysporum]|nr:hypothetical protein QL093DRAFT_2140912 [Fusarium oxysporum]